MMKKILLTIVLLFALCGLTQAGTLTIQNDGVTIRASALNQESSTLVMVGNVNITDILRGTIAFPLTDPELTRAAVNSVSITFNGSGSDATSTGIRDIAVHECSSFVDTEVTWYKRYATTNWTTPGGDSGPVLDTQTVNTDTFATGSSVTFSGAALAAAVESKLGGTFYALVKMTDDTTTDFRSLLRLNDTVSISIDYTDISANTPFPSDGIYHKDSSVTFGWKPGIDPANPADPNPAILKHLLTYRTGDPNFLEAGTTTVEIDADTDLDGLVDPDAVYGPVTFGLDQVVYWKVDEITADPNAIPGHVWSFTTLLSTPELNTELPADTSVGIGEYVELTVDAINPFIQNDTGLSYQWYYSADDVTYSPVGINSSVLAIASAQAVDQGYYYCDVTVESNAKTVSSRTAYLLVKQTLAHWTMDQADFVGGQYFDIAGGHNADPNTAPTFVDGAGPDAPAAGAAVIAPDSYGMVGTWNPSETTGQFTMSAWINWDGSDLGVGKHIMAKRDTYNPDGMMFELRLNDENHDGIGDVRFYSHISDGTLVYPKGVVSPNTWTHVCVVYGSGKAQVYINGQLKGTDTTAILSSKTDAALTIGGPTMFPGALDNVMMHNYAMSADDVATLYYQTSQKAICLYPPATDLNSDCETNLLDFAILAQNWLDCGQVPAESCFE